MGNKFCCPTLVGRTSAWCLVETSCFCEAIVNYKPVRCFGGFMHDFCIGTTRSNNISRWLTLLS